MEGEDELALLTPLLGQRTPGPLRGCSKAAVRYHIDVCVSYIYMCIYVYPYIYGEKYISMYISIYTHMDIFKSSRTENQYMFKMYMCMYMYTHTRTYNVCWNRQRWGAAAPRDIHDFEQQFSSWL